MTMPFALAAFISLVLAYMMVQVVDLLIVQVVGQKLLFLPTNDFLEDL